MKSDAEIGEKVLATPKDIFAAVRAKCPNYAEVFNYKPAPTYDGLMIREEIINRVASELHCSEDEVIEAMHAAYDSGFVVKKVPDRSTQSKHGLPFATIATQKLQQLFNVKKCSVAGAV